MKTLLLTFLILCGLTFSATAEPLYGVYKLDSLMTNVVYVPYGELIKLNLPVVGTSDEFHVYVRTTKPVKVSRGVEIILTLRNATGETKTVNELVKNTGGASAMKAAFQMEIGWEPVQCEVLELVSSGGMRMTNDGAKQAGE